MNKEKKNKIQIAFIIHHVSNGGAERIVSYLTKGFSDDKYNKYLIVDNRNDIEYECRANFISLNLFKKKSIFYKILNNIIRFIKISKIKRELKITKSISLLDKPNIINILTKKNEKVIISIRNCMSEESKTDSNIKKKIIKYLYSKSDKIISISEGVKLDLVENYNLDNNKIQVIYNPIDSDSIIKIKDEKIEKEYEDIFKNPVIINAGRLTRQKGQWHLIRAFSKVVEKIPNVNLVIMGEGELRAELELLIKKLNLEKNVHLIGFKPNLFKYINKSTLFVLSSLFEGFGNVILEAMMCSVPIISTDCKYGPREILNPKTDLKKEIKEVEYGEYGILVPKLNSTMDFNSLNLDNEESILANTITSILNNKDIINEYRTRGLSRINDFNIVNIIKEWEKL